MCSSVLGDGGKEARFCMPWKPNTRGEEVPRDPSLDLFRDSAAEVFDDVTAGFVVFRVEPWWTRTAGHLWWGRWDHVQERVEFLETVWLDRAHVGDASCAHGEAGLVGADSTWLEDIRRGVYVYDEPPTVPQQRGGRRSLSLRWLEGSELALVRAQWGFGDT